MTIRIGSEIANTFRGYFESPEFAKEERDYKWAVHLLIKPPLSDKHLDCDAFPSLLAKLMTGKLEPRDVGLSFEEAAAVQKKGL